MPHEPVIRQNAESTKVRIVYDASVRATPTRLSLNDCLETSPVLQNLLWVSLFDQDSDQLCYVGTLKKFYSKLLSKKKIKMCFDFIGLITEI